jgi:hypothetical protein
VLSIICIGDGFGGCDGTIPDGGAIPEGCSVKDPKFPSRVYCPPSALKNYWMTTEPDQANYSAWCYGTSSKNAASVMAEMKREIQASN